MVQTPPPLAHARGGAAAAAAKQPVPTIESIVESMRNLRSEYEGASENKWLQRPPDMPYMGAGPDYHYRDETKFFYMLEMARHLENDDPAVSQGLGRFCNNVIQGGYTYAPNTGVDWVDRQLVERWEAWTDPLNQEGTDFEAEHNWHTFERLTARRVVMDGDLVVLPLANGSLQAFEAHRLRSPLAGPRGRLSDRRFVVHGVEKNRNRQVARYWLTRDETDGFGFSRFQNSRNVQGRNKWSFDGLTARNELAAFHLYDPRRFSQSRGVNAFHAVLTTSGMHKDLQFAKLVQAQMTSYIGFWHKIPLSASDQYEPPTQELVQCPRTGQMVPKGYDMSPGMSYWPQYADEELLPLSANVPNEQYFPHAKLLLTFIAAAIDMPLILFLLDATETNFSAWRGAFIQFQLAAERFQLTHSHMFHRPVIRFKQRQWLRQDIGLRRAFDVLGEDFFHHDWRFPRWRHVQPLEDVKAEVMEVANLMDSPRGIAARHNRDFAEIVRQTCEDRSDVIRCALEAAAVLNTHPYIAANPHERITWREIASLPLSESLQMQLLSGDPDVEAGATGGGVRTEATAS